MCRRVHVGITVIAERLHFQMTNLVGLAIIMNEVINRFSILQIQHLADEAMIHHESRTLITAVTDLTRVSVSSHYIGLSNKGREIRKDGWVITGLNKGQFFRPGNPST
jgi:hypothetical protein